MIDIFLPFLAGLVIGATVTYIVLRKKPVSVDIVRQALAVLTTLYTALADDGKLSDTERAELREEVRKLITALKP